MDSNSIKIFKCYSILILNDEIVEKNIILKNLTKAKKIVIKRIRSILIEKNLWIMKL